MERRIDHLEDRLRAMSGALRLRGVVRRSDPVQPDPRGAAPPRQALRLRGGGSGVGE